MLNDCTPVDRFDVAGAFEYQDNIQPLEAFPSAALAARPDLKAALQTIEKAETDHRLAIANGSTDPTFSFDMGRLPPVYVGVGVSIPLRIFDKNQGEKLRTQIDIDHARRQKDAAESQVFSDGPAVVRGYQGVSQMIGSRADKPEQFAKKRLDPFARELYLQWVRKYTAADVHSSFVKAKRHSTNKVLPFIFRLLVRPYVGFETAILLVRYLLGEKRHTVEDQTGSD